MLKEFFSHGVDHPHGWGMAFFYFIGKTACGALLN